MSEEPIHSEEPTGDRPSRRSRLIMTTGILLAVAAVIVVVVLLVTGGGDETDDTSGPGTDIGITNITSPYDVHELPADTDLGDVEDATLVSISLVTTGGGAAYYGLSSDTEPAQALIKAVADAKALEAAEVSTTQAGAEGAPPAVSTLTFLLPDRGTLTFDLDTGQGIITRDGQAWRVEGNLAALIDAAVTYQQQ